MLLTALLVFLIPSAVIILVNIIYNKIFFGEVDDSINAYNATSRFNPRTSLNKFLNAKMVYYGRLHPVPMRWFVFYSNYILPLLAVVTIYNVAHDIIQGLFTFEPNNLLYLLFALSNLFNVLTIRGIDALSFYFNLVPTILLLLYVSVTFNDESVLYLVLLVPILSANIYYFIHRKELFLNTLRQLKNEFESQNSIIDDN